MLPLDLSAGMRPEAVGDVRALPLADAVHDLTGTALEAPDADARLTPADAGLLRAEFGTVEVEVLDRETLVPEVEPVVAFVDSTRALTGAVLPAEVSWADLLGAVRARVAGEIDRHGVWRLGNQVGVLTCR